MDKIAERPCDIAAGLGLRNDDDHGWSGVVGAGMGRGWGGGAVKAGGKAYVWHVWAGVRGNSSTARPTWINAEHIRRECRWASRANGA
jgi:hypothetical protein